MPDAPIAGWIIARRNTDGDRNVNWIADFDGEVHTDHDTAVDLLAFAGSAQQEHDWRLLTVRDETAEADHRT